jgi:hypothetical protein
MAIRRYYTVEYSGKDAETGVPFQQAAIQIRAISSYEARERAREELSFVQDLVILCAYPTVKEVA